MENGINCTALSEALTECLLSVGIKARTLYMMPCSPCDFDNHVVTEVWVSARTATVRRIGLFGGVNMNGMSNIYTSAQTFFINK